MSIATASSRRNAIEKSSDGAMRSESVLSAATAMFAEHGFQDTDVQDVADAASVGKGTVYRLFPTKRALFLAAADRAMQLLHADVQAAVNPADDPLNQIACAIRAYLDFFARHPDFVELLIQERAAFRDRAKPTYFLHREANIGPWKQLFQRLIAAGRVRDLSVDRITDVMSGLVYGTMFTNFFAGRRKSSASQAEDIMDVVFCGILTPQEQAARRRRS